MLPDYPKVKNDLQQFFDTWLRERVRRRLGALSEIPRHRVFEGTGTSMLRPSGQEDVTPMQRYATEFEISFEEVPRMTLPDILSRLDKAAQDVADQIGRSLYQAVSDAADQIGNVVKASQGFTLAVIFEMLEKIDIPFDQDGNPELPEIHIHPESAETLKEALISLQNDPELRSRYNEILLGKKEQWRVREAHRKLVGSHSTGFSGGEAQGHTDSRPRSGFAG